MIKPLLVGAALCVALPVLAVDRAANTDPSAPAAALLRTSAATPIADEAPGAATPATAAMIAAAVLAFAGLGLRLRQPR